jgi:hypothetical protein
MGEDAVVHRVTLAIAAPLVLAACGSSDQAATLAARTIRQVRTCI